MQMPDTHWDRLPESERQRIHDQCGGARLPPEMVERGRRLFNLDLSGVRVHRRGAASLGALQMGAEGYTSGNDVAWRDPGSLHTAAHDAAHVINQYRGGDLTDCEARRRAELLTRAGEDFSSWRRSSD
jgi:hypothetical protein